MSRSNVRAARARWRRQILGVRKRGQLTQIGTLRQADHRRFREDLLQGNQGDRVLSVPVGFPGENALHLTKTKKVKLEPLVSDVFPLSDWKKAFEMFERKEGLKLVFDPKK